MTTDNRPETTDNRPQTSDRRPETADHRPKTMEPACPHAEQRASASANSPQDQEPRTKDQGQGTKDQEQGTKDNEQIPKDQAPRTICANIITQWLNTSDFPDRMLPSHSNERALMQEIVYGVCRWIRLLEEIIKQLVPREPDPQTKAYLLVGLYQIFLMDNIPPHAAANETVEAAKADLDQARIRFLNGVLRNSLRRSDEIQEILHKQSLAIRTSHPDILVDRWTEEFGEETTADICNWNNKRPPVILRVNHHRTTTKEYTIQLKAIGIETELHPADNKNRFLFLPSGVSIPELPGYTDGLFSIQDPATILAVDMLDLKHGLTVLDACAAPGGKTFACAEQMHNKGTIIALDRHDDRIAQLRECFY